MDDGSHWKKLLKSLRAELKDHSARAEALKPILDDEAPADIALALEEFDPEDAKVVFAVLGRACSIAVLGLLAPELTQSLVATIEPKEVDKLAEQLPKREAAALLARQSKKTIRETAEAGLVSTSVAEDARQRSHYRVGTAGRIMTTEFVRLRADMTIAEALEQVRKTNRDNDLPDDICVVEPDATSEPRKDRLIGVISIRDAVMASPQQRVGDIMAAQPLCVVAETDTTDAARLLSKHKFLALPVTDSDGHLLGLIPAEDLMEVTLARLHERYSRAVGADAAAMERMSPAQAAVKRQIDVDALQRVDRRHAAESGADHYDPLLTHSAEPAQDPGRRTAAGLNANLAKPAVGRSAGGWDQRPHRDQPCGAGGVAREPPGFPEAGIALGGLAFPDADRSFR